MRSVLEELFYGNILGHANINNDSHIYRYNRCGTQAKNGKYEAHHLKEKIPM